MLLILDSFSRWWFHIVTKSISKKSLKAGGNVQRNSLERYAFRFSKVIIAIFTVLEKCFSKEVAEVFRTAVSTIYRPV